MPLYDYRCEKCQTVFEQRRAMADVDKATVCPACNSLLTTRRLNTVAVIGAGRASERPQTPTNQKPHRRSCPCCVPVRSQKMNKQGV